MIHDDVLKAREFVAFLYDRTQRGLGAVAFVRVADAALRNVEVSSSEEMWMLRLLAWGMLEFLAMRVARMLDPPERGNACLPEVFRLLDNKAVLVAVVDAAPNIISRQDRQADMDEALRCWQAVSADERRKRLRDLRNHLLSHNLIHKSLADGLAGGLTVGELLAYAEDVFAIMNDLAWGCLGTSDLDKVRAASTNQASEIWRRLIPFVMGLERN